MRMVRTKALVLILALWMGNNPSGWTCTCGFIYTVIWHSLLFHAKKYGTGWMDGWMDGWWSWVKDCFQQSKNIGCFFCFFRCGNLYIRLNRFLYLEHQKYLFGWVGEISVPGEGDVTSCAVDNQLWALLSSNCKKIIFQFCSWFKLYSNLSLT